MNEPKPISNVVSAAESILRAQAMARTTETVFRLTSSSLSRFEAGIPVEYQAAVLPPKLAEIIREEPASVALIGPPGTGKTYLCWAVLRHARQVQVHRLMADGEVVQEGERPGVWLNRVVERVCADKVMIISEAKDIRRHRHDRDWLDESARHRSLLCVDDIGFTGKADDWVVEAIYHLANERRSNGRKTMWTSNLSADEMRNILGAAVASRILGGAVVPVEGPDRRLA